MIDYLVWRGDFTLEQTPWCAIDALIAASLSYLNFHGVDNAAGWTLSEAKRIDLLQKDPGSPTFPNRSWRTAPASRNAGCITLSP